MGVALSETGSMATVVFVDNKLQSGLLQEQIDGTNNGLSCALKRGGLRQWALAVGSATMGSTTRKMITLT